MGSDKNHFNVLLTDPLLVKKVSKGVERYMKRHGYHSVNEMTGRLTLNTDTVLCG